MKKRLFLLVLAAGLCGMAKAQTQVTEIVVEDRLPGFRTTFEANKFWDNWFVSANFGGSVLIAEHNQQADFKNTINFFPTLSVGKWFKPWWGLRVQGGGGSLHGFTEHAESMLHMHYIQMHADFMLGLVNFFGKYKQDRVFDIVPYFGIGGFTRKKDQSFTMNAGIQFKFALSERFDFNIEAQGIVLDDDMVEKAGFPNDVIAGLSGGFTYRFKNRGFRVAPNRAELENLEVSNAMLRNRVSQLENRPAEVRVIEKEVMVPADEVSVSNLPITVSYKFNSSKILPTEEATIYNIAKFMQDNPNVKARIVGYADKFGPINVNLRISKERAEAVANVLQRDYRISRDRMIIEYVGKEKPYYKNENSWNRAAMVEFID